MSLKSLSYYIFLTQQRMCIGHGQPGCTASGSNGFFSSKLLKCIPENQKKTICHPGTFVSVTTKNTTDLNRWKHETQSNSMQNFPSIAWPKSISNRPISQPSIQRKQFKSLDENSNHWEIWEFLQVSHKVHHIDHRPKGVWFDRNPPRDITDKILTDIVLVDEDSWEESYLPFAINDMFAVQWRLTSICFRDTFILIRRKRVLSDKDRLQL